MQVPQLRRQYPLRESWSSSPTMYRGLSSHSPCTKRQETLIFTKTLDLCRADIHPTIGSDLPNRAGKPSKQHKR